MQGVKELQINIETNYTDEALKKIICKELNIRDFSFQILKKSLDARKKTNIHWSLKLEVVSKEFEHSDFVAPETLEITRKKRKEKVIVVGTGPAGFFAAYILLLGGYNVTIIERGSIVEQRTNAIMLLNKKGEFSEQNNYAFGEGGAGTFSDGKLTSRSKHISAERNFILKEYVRAGAPQEILYLSHPHIGTDNLKIIVANLRKKFLEKGGEILFDTKLQDIIINKNIVDRIVTDKGIIEANYFILATGNSAYDTYRMLIKRGVLFNTKNFAIGHRVEHKQSLINKAQWGQENILGLKAAEYKLTYKASTGLPVYSFCMCPGGTVVQSAAFKEKSVVNGMSRYKRNGDFANAGIVAGIHPDLLVGHKARPLEILDWMDNLEHKFYAFSNNYLIPANMVSDYKNFRNSKKICDSSYILGLKPFPLYKMLPEIISKSIAESMNDFSNKIKGFEQGILMGLESKTSSPLQVVRDKKGKCEGFENLYFVGEGSGFAGGIISSAADGVKCALNLLNK